jgi:hypothetical protein
MALDLSGPKVKETLSGQGLGGRFQQICGLQCAIKQPRRDLREIIAAFACDFQGHTLVGGHAKLRDRKRDLSDFGAMAMVNAKGAQPVVHLVGH